MYRCLLYFAFSLIYLACGQCLVSFCLFAPRNSLISFHRIQSLLPPPQSSMIEMDAFWSYDCFISHLEFEFPFSKLSSNLLAQIINIKDEHINVGKASVYRCPKEHLLYIIETKINKSRQTKWMWCKFIPMLHYTETATHTHTKSHFKRHTIMNVCSVLLRFDVYFGRMLQNTNNTHTIIYRVYMCGVRELNLRLTYSMFHSYP